jgi:hypothetical protein
VKFVKMSTRIVLLVKARTVKIILRLVLARTIIMRGQEEKTAINVVTLNVSHAIQVHLPNVLPALNLISERAFLLVPVKQVTTK